MGNLECWGKRSPSSPLPSPPRRGRRCSRVWRRCALSICAGFAVSAGGKHCFDQSWRRSISFAVYSALAPSFVVRIYPAFKNVCHSGGGVPLGRMMSGTFSRWQISRIWPVVNWPDQKRFSVTMASSGGTGRRAWNGYKPKSE